MEDKKPFDPFTAGGTFVAPPEGKKPFDPFTAGGTFVAPPEEAFDPIANGATAVPETVKKVDTFREDLEALSKPKVSKTRSFLEGAREELGMGFGDEISATFGALYDVATDENAKFNDFSRVYGMNKRDIQEQNAAAKQDNPDTYTTGQVAGFAAGSALPLGAIAKIGNGAGKLSKGLAAVDKLTGMPGRVLGNIAGKGHGLLNKGVAKTSEMAGKLIPDDLPGAASLKKMLPQNIYELAAANSTLAGNVIAGPAAQMAIRKTGQGGKKVIDSITGNLSKEQLDGVKNAGGRLLQQGGDKLNLGGAVSDRYNAANSALESISTQDDFINQQQNASSLAERRIKQRETQ